MARPLLNPEFGILSKAEESHIEREMAKLRKQGKLSRNTPRSKYRQFRYDMILDYRTRKGIPVF
ncbi:hypothetical protein QTO02_29450, partial [Vibrio fortis]